MHPLNNIKFLLKLTANVLAVLIVMLLFFQKSYSQSPAKQVTVDSLNNWLKPTAKIEVKGNNIFFKSYDEKGLYIKEDKAPISDLSITSTYESESNLICIPCLKDVEGCVMRTLIVQKIKRPFNRISITPGDKTKIAKINKALQHLIRLESEVGYKEIVSFETE